jgi:putative salt-induced outer membrane protein YdiY
MKKTVFDKAFLSEDLTVYPGLKNSAGVISRSETVFSDPLQKNLDLEIKYIIESNSKPPLDKKKTDAQTIIGIKYIF